MAELSFAWDKEKNAANIRNHGIDFLDAALIFENPRVEAIDESSGLRRVEMYRAWVIGGDSAARRLHLARRKRCPHGQRKEGKPA
jgi:uncharacterized DUF497 family protein